MALPLLPAALVALRAVTAGRAALAARSMLESPAGRRVAGHWAARRYRDQQANSAAQSAAPRPASAPPSPSDNVRRAREFYGRAARHFGVPRPSGNQLMAFAQQEAQQRSQKQGTDEATSSLRQLAARTAATAAAMGTLRLATRDFGRGIEERVAALRMYSPTLNTAAAKVEHRELLRQIERARRTAWSSAALLQARSDLADAKEPYVTGWQNISNVGSLGATKVKTWLIEALPTIASVLPPGLKAVAHNLEILADIGKKFEEKQAGLQGEFKDYLRTTSQGRYPMNPSPDEMHGRGGRR